MPLLNNWQFSPVFHENIFLELPLSKEKWHSTVLRALNIYHPTLGDLKVLVLIREYNSSLNYELYVHSLDMNKYSHVPTITTSSMPAHNNHLIKFVSINLVMFIFYE